MTVQNTKSELVMPDKSYDLANPKDLVNFAETLKTVIVQQKLFTNVKGKNFVHVEGWQFAGFSLGIVPIVTSLERIEAEGEMKYRAEVELRRVSDDQKVGYGVAICSNKEKGRNDQDEFAIASMAQTRAVGKAFRTVLSWLMKMAGYEATPAEEMYYVSGDDVIGEVDEAKVKNNIKKQRAQQPKTKAKAVK